MTLLLYIEANTFAKQRWQLDFFAISPQKNQVAFSQGFRIEYKLTYFYLLKLHRVQVPKADPKRLHSPRYSIIFFHDPDREAVVKCLDGSNKYPPIKAGEYIDGVLEEIFSPEYWWLSFTHKEGSAFFKLILVLAIKELCSLGSQRYKGVLVIELKWCYMAFGVTRGLKEIANEGRKINCFNTW